jgi:hypothetical protein
LYQIDGFGGFLDDDGNFKGGGFSETDDDSQIIAIYVKDYQLPKSFRFTGSTVDNDHLFLESWRIIRLKDMTDTNYNGDWENTDFASQERTSAGIAVFAKSQSSVGPVKQGLSFGEIKGLDSLTLLETYYSVTQRSLNDPVKPYARFCLPEKVFLGLDMTAPIRLKTDRINNIFIANKITGYYNSETECVIELIKIG